MSRGGNVLCLIGGGNCPLTSFHRGESSYPPNLNRGENVQGGKYHNVTSIYNDNNIWLEKHYVNTAHFLAITLDKLVF